jgi:hypothetical protein
LMPTGCIRGCRPDQVGRISRLVGMPACSPVQASL